MAIRYKVIFEKSRKSIYAQGSYTLVYDKDTIVKAIKGSLGVMVFKRRRQAKRFMDQRLMRASMMIIRVRTFSRGVVPKRISAQVSDYSIKNFYSEVWSTETAPPVGTICYDRVGVLD